MRESTKKKTINFLSLCVPCKDGETLYFVKWRGFDVLDNTWETEQKIQR